MKRSCIFGKWLFCLVLLCFFAHFLLSQPATALTTTTPHNERVKEGEVAEYYVRVLNDDHPFGVSIRMTVIQEVSRYETENTEFYLYPGQSDTAYITVYTDGVTAENLTTDVIFYKKGEEESEYSEFGARFFTTFIDHPQQDEGSSIASEAPAPNVIILAAGGFSLFAFVFSCAHYWKEGSLPFLAGYSRLMKKDVLENPTRQMIYETVCCNPEGIAFSELLEETGIHHKSNLHYQLGRLREFGYVRRSDSLYYPAGASMQRSFVDQIRDAVAAGYRSPHQVASRIGSYPERVRYHMEKEGLWKRRKNGKGKLD